MFGKSWLHIFLDSAVPFRDNLHPKILQFNIVLFSLWGWLFFWPLLGKAISSEEQLSLFSFSGPNGNETKQPVYPGFERDVLKTVADYFQRLKEPLLTFHLYEVFVNILSECFTMWIQYNTFILLLVFIVSRLLALINSYFMKLIFSFSFFFLSLQVCCRSRR